MKYFLFILATVIAATALAIKVRPAVVNKSKAAAGDLLTTAGDVIKYGESPEFFLRAHADGCVIEYTPTGEFTVGITVEKSFKDLTDKEIAELKHTVWMANGAEWEK